MSGHLTWVMSHRTALDLGRDTGAALVLSGADSARGLERLNAGEKVVALMAAMGIGVVLPQGTEVVFHDECPKDGALRAQAEMRDPRNRGSQGLDPFGPA